MESGDLQVGFACSAKLRPEFRAHADILILKKIRLSVLGFFWKFRESDKADAFGKTNKLVIKRGAAELLITVFFLFFVFLNRCQSLLYLFSKKQKLDALDIEEGKPTS